MEIKGDNKRVLEFMHEHGSITPLDAIWEFGIIRLAAVIYKLKHNHGIAIETHYETARDRFGEYTRYARYTFPEEPT